MLKKLIMLIAAVFVFTMVADHLGIIPILLQEEKPKVLEIRDQFVLKTSKSLDPIAY